MLGSVLGPEPQPSPGPCHLLLSQWKGRAEHLCRGGKASPRGLSSRSVDARMRLWWGVGMCEGPGRKAADPECCAGELGGRRRAGRERFPCPPPRLT